MPGVNFDDRRSGLDRYQSVMEATGFDVETHVVRGTPYRRINGIAETVHADVTIVGSRGQSRIRRLLLGSVSEEIVARTAGNVYLVPPPRTV